jgi:hypothetical protein
MKSIALLAALVTAGFCSPASAEDKPLTGPEILKLLVGTEVAGDGWTQSFAAGGATTYTAPGGVSTGRWDVRGDTYCSVWPPSDSWACYAMTIDAAGTAVVWIADSGSRTEAHITSKGQ